MGYGLHVFNGVERWCYENECEVCHRTFYSIRSGAKTCGPNCRKQRSRADERKLSRIAELQSIGRRVNQIAKEYPDSQDVLDQVHLLKQAVDRATKQFDVTWHVQRLAE